MIKLHFWSVEAVAPIKSVAGEEIKVITTFSSMSYKHFVLFLQENTIPAISHEIQTFYQHNMLWLMQHYALGSITK